MLFLTPEMNYKYQSKGRDRLIFLSFNSPRLKICVHVWNGPEPLGWEIAGHGLLLPRKERSTIRKVGKVMLWRYRTLREVTSSSVHLNSQGNAMLHFLT